MIENIMQADPNKRYLLFMSISEALRAQEYKEQYYRNLLSDFTIEEFYMLANCEEIIDKLMGKEANKLNNDSYVLLFWFQCREKTIPVLLKYLMKNRIQNYMVISDEDYFALHNKYFQKYLAGKNVDLSSPILSIGDFNINNFFLRPEYKFHLGDTVLPSLFGDCSMIDEGAYEYGCVSLSPGDIAIDAGANIGSFSSIALSKGCEVHAFEPFPSTFSLLSNNMSYYNQEKIHLCNQGLADKEYVADFFIYKSFNSGRHSMVLNTGNCHVEQFPVTTVDKYVALNQLKKVDFIKADIEGEERYMLEGARNTISRFLPKLSICTYHFPDDPAVLERIIHDISDRYVIEHKWSKLYAHVPGIR